MGPIEVIGEVTVAAGPGAAGNGAAHRAWPSIERTDDGGLVVAYKVGPDHHKTDDGVVWVARSEDGGRTWPFRRPVVAEPGWDVFTHHGLTRLADGSLLLHCVRARHLGAEEAGDAGEGAFFARGAFIRSADGGRTWHPHGPSLEMPFISATGRGFCYGKIQELAGGALIVPFYGTPADRTDELQRVLAIVRSDDGGRSWREYSLISPDPFSLCGRARPICCVWATAGCSQWCEPTPGSGCTDPGQRTTGSPGASSSPRRCPASRRRCWGWSPAQSCAPTVNEASKRSAWAAR